MPKKEKLNFEDLYYDFEIDGDLINFLAFYYKKITSMTSEQLAYEYLKRNPIFLNDVLNDIKRLGLIKKNEDNLMKLISKMKYHYQKTYLYNPIDLYGRYTNYDNLSLDTLLDVLENQNKDNFSYSYLDFINEGETSKSQYVNLYNEDIYNINEAKYDSYQNKQKNSIPLDGLFNFPIKSSRWLNWLRPSINIEINPNKNKDELKEQFQKLLTLFENNEKLNHVNHISAPNYLLDNFDIDKLKNESLLLDIKTSRNTAMQLFFYDAINIFGLSEFTFSKLTSIFEMAFEKSIEEYIDTENSKNDIDDNTYKTYFTNKAIRLMTYAKPYIYGNYLKLIYPKISIEKHYYDMKDIARMKSSQFKFFYDVTDILGIEFSESKFLCILDISEEEYMELNKNNILNISLEDKIKIIQFLTRSPFDEIDKIKCNN